MEEKRVPYQRWGGGWILCSGCGHVGFAQLYVAGECYRLGAAGTLSVPNGPVGLDRRDRGVGLAAKNRHSICCSRPLRCPWSTERVPSQHSSEYREGNKCS